jgi:hypothetical protein
MSFRNGFRITPRHVLGLFVALAGTLLPVSRAGYARLKELL